MGTVYRAEHTLLGRAVAIKVLQPELSRDQDMVNRFFKEACATARLRHPGIIEVFDFGYCGDGAGFIVMELLYGESLARRLAREARLPWLQACSLARQIASSLAAAHRAGVVHRDLKPENVFLVMEPDQREERTKVLDFGIAKLIDTGSELHLQTRPGLLMGTPAYMSPEQCRGAANVDHRADIYSLGCILFEMVCGRLPFVGDVDVDLIAAHIMTPPPSPGWLAPEIPEALVGLLLRMLAKREVDRPQSMEAVAAELHAITDAGDSSRDSRPAAVTTQRGSAGEMRTDIVRPLSQRRSSHTFAATVVALMVSAVVAVVATVGPGARVGGGGRGERGEHDGTAGVLAARVGVRDGRPRMTNIAPQRVVHEIACDPECEVVLDGAVVGKAAPEIPYRVELQKLEGQSRTYVLRPIGSRHRETTYRAPADRSVKTTIRLPCAPLGGQGASGDAALDHPSAPCREG